MRSNGRNQVAACPRANHPTVVRHFQKTVVLDGVSKQVKVAIQNTNHQKL
jgi:hypothetical protein